MIIKTEIRSQETRRFIICQSKGQADILKAAELSIFKITMEGKAKKYEDRKDLTDYMEPVGEKESSYGSDGRKFFVAKFPYSSVLKYSFKMRVYVQTDAFA